MWSQGPRPPGAAFPLYSPQLTPAELSALVAYKNRGADLSLTYRYVLSPVYDRLVHLLPASAAPNLVTLVGFLLAAAGHFAVVLSAPTFSEPVPAWAALLAGVGLALYMVLDNLDGRQARRTGSSSPLGHLFDHGCDALNTTLSGMALAATLRVGPARALAFVLFGQATLLAATLEELATGAMILPALNGPNEGLLLAIGVHLTGALAPAFWAAPRALPLPTAPPRGWADTNGQVVMLLGGALAGAGAALSLRAVVRHGGAAAAARALPRQMAGFAAYAAAYIAWAAAAPAAWAGAARVALWTGALFAFDLVSRVILVHLTRSAPFPHAPPLLPCVLAPVAAAALLAPPQAAAVAALALAAAAAAAAWRAACIVEQLCEFLNVRCFRLGPRAPRKTRAEAAARPRGALPAGG